MTRNIQLVSTSNVDDASFLALKDFCDLTTTQNVRVVGGQMIEIMRTAFPTPGLTVRSTIDADAAIEKQFASTGELHQLLTNAGYEATHGNSYKKGRQKIDLLVGNMVGKFKKEIFGERAFDSAPGIQLALDAQPLEFNIQATLRDGTGLEFVARTPTVEIAVCIKSLSYQSRLSQQDMVDLYYLLKIVNTHAVSDLGGWRLDQVAKATRLDSQRALQALSQNLQRPSNSISADINREEFIALLSKWVAKP
jgi:hypothetical protein